MPTRARAIQVIHGLQRHQHHVRRLIFGKWRLRARLPVFLQQRPLWRGLWRPEG